MRRAVLITILASCLSAVGVRAELSVVLDGDGNYRGTLLMYRSVDGAPQLWTQYRDIPQRLVLNPSGDRFRDGEPHVAVNPLTRVPEVVWSLRDDKDYEVAYAQFDGERWTSPFLEPGQQPPEATLPRHLIPLLTENGSDDFDPRIAVNPRGIAEIVWWRTAPDVDSVFYSSLDSSDADVRAPAQISHPGFDAQYPDIYWYGGTTHVAYEQRVGAFREVLALGRQSDLEPFGYQHIDATLMTSPVRVDFAVDQTGAFFLSWMHAVDVLGVSYYELGRWSAPIYLPR